MMSVYSASTKIKGKEKPFISSTNSSEPPIETKLEWWITNQDPFDVSPSI